MRGARICSVFALTWLFCAGSHGQEEPKLQCDDQGVHDVVDFALLHHNLELTAGGQLALYQIVEATKAKNETGEIMSLGFTVRESDCPVGGDKVWSQCDYLQEHAKPLMVCHAKVLLKEPKEVLSHECSVEVPVKPVERPPCLGCPVSINVESEDIRESLSYSLSKANMVHNHPHFFILNNVGSATRQVIAGFRYRLRFDMVKSNCSKSEFKEVTEECHTDEEDKTFINCNSTVDVAPWRHELPDTQVQCGPGPLAGRFSVRRRPPGWSPLRNFQSFAAVRPTKPPKKGDSSEESQEGKAPTKTPTEAHSPAPPARPPPPPPKPVQLEETTVSPTAPSNCPSKPWKEFNPPPPPTPSNVTKSDFSDVDLLA